MILAILDDNNENINFLEDNGNDEGHIRCMSKDGRQLNEKEKDRVKILIMAYSKVFLTESKNTDKHLDESLDNIIKNLNAESKTDK